MRTIAVLSLADRIAAEVESGRVDDVEMSDEAITQIAAVLCPSSVALAEVGEPTVIDALSAPLAEAAHVSTGDPDRLTSASGC